MRIVFMGTPSFAVPSLQKLIDRGEEVVGVYTQPDRPKGRGYKLAPPPVKELALQHALPVFQPETLKENVVFEQLKALAPDLIIVVAYGKLLPERVLELPKYHCINVHGSLLPKYRGAAPIQWSVLNGDKESGVTTMYLAKGVDTGDMIAKKVVTIGEDETASELYDRLSYIGAELLAETVEAIKSGTVVATPQNDAEATHAPMLTKEMAKIDFSKPAQDVHNQIRGLSDWPCAYTMLEGKRLKVYHSKVSSRNGTPAELLSEKQFIVGCGNGSVEFTEVQYEGSKRMDGGAFLRGKRLPLGTKLLEE